MLKQEFNRIISNHHDGAFKGFSQLMIARKYGQETKGELNTERTFLQNELIDFIKEVNISKGPSKELHIPRSMTKAQIDSILSEILNQLL